MLKYSIEPQRIPTPHGTVYKDFAGDVRGISKPNPSPGEAAIFAFEVMAELPNGFADDPVVTVTHDATGNVRIVIAGRMD